jgi:hypothetical protein
MQQPTHPRLHVRDVRDAHIVFEAVRQGLLRPVVRRLNEMERLMHIRSGAIFVWEECGDESGLKRWTDGRVWSQSRMREPYLFYDERLPSDDVQNTSDQRHRSPTYRFVGGVSRNSPTSPAMSHYERSGQHPGGLVKQAYSAWVLLGPNAKPRKWHLTAYFTYSDLQNLPTPDRDPIFRRLVVPPGVYRSGKTRSKNDQTGETELGLSNSSSSLETPSPPSHTQSPRPESTRTCVLQSPIGAHSSHSSQPRTHVARPPEDERMIQMLNAKHIL